MIACTGVRCWSAVSHYTSSSTGVPSSDNLWLRDLDDTLSSDILSLFIAKSAILASQQAEQPTLVLLALMVGGFPRVLQLPTCLSTSITP
jgi:hypothetical protein